MRRIELAAFALVIASSGLASAEPLRAEGPSASTVAPQALIAAPVLLATSTPTGPRLSNLRAAAAGPATPSAPGAAPSPRQSEAKGVDRPASIAKADVADVGGASTPALIVASLAAPIGTSDAQSPRRDLAERATRNVAPYAAINPYGDRILPAPLRRVEADPSPNAPKTDAGRIVSAPASEVESPVAIAPVVRDATAPFGADVFRAAARPTAPTPAMSIERAAAPGPRAAPFASFVDAEPGAWSLDRLQPFVTSIYAGDVDVRRLQTALHGLGYDPGRVDGLFGPISRRALVACLSDRCVLPVAAAQPLGER